MTKKMIAVEIYGEGSEEIILPTPFQIKRKNIFSF